MQPRGRIGSPPLRYLSSAELDECLPDVDTRLDLAAAALTALSRGTAEMPAKIGVHPRPGALLHAMPAWLRSEDIVGLKWIAAFPGNSERGLPAINGLIVLNDPDTGTPTWIMDAARITAVRTAAVSGVAIRLLAPAAVERVAIVGGGVQARSHAEIVGALLPDAELVIYYRHLNRAEAVAADARAAGLAASVAGSAEVAVGSAQVVVTACTLARPGQVMTPNWVAPGSLVVSIDFATYASAKLARAARLFAVDDREQFLAYRDGGHFDGYPDPTATLGELLEASATATATATATEADQKQRPVLVNHLGVGLADVMFAAAIARGAGERGAGTELQR